MSPHYRALLIGNGHFPADPHNLADLNGPPNDISRLAEVLTNPRSGLVAPGDVTVLAERESYEISAALERFFRDATKDQVLLVYYSGHGLTIDDDGSLLLCGRNTRFDSKLTTTVSAEAVNHMIQFCPATVVLILDCCYAGAFKGGGLADELFGKGRFVLAASRPKERARDADNATGLSRFTAHLVRGLAGEAAATDNEWITLSDLYAYVHRTMVRKREIEPQRRFDGTGEIVVGRNPSWLVPVREPFSLSKYVVDIRDIEPDEQLPTEKVLVRGTAAWQVECDASWIAINKDAQSFGLVFTPSIGSNRANVDVHDRVSGQALTVRVSIRVKESGFTETKEVFSLSYPSATFAQQSPPVPWRRYALVSGKMLLKILLWCLIVIGSSFYMISPAMLVEVSSGLYKDPTANQAGLVVGGVIFTGIFGGLIYLFLFVALRKRRQSTIYVLGLGALALEIEALTLFGRHRVLLGLFLAPIWAAALSALVILLIRDILQNREKRPSGGSTPSAVVVSESTSTQGSPYLSSSASDSPIGGAGTNQSSITASRPDPTTGFQPSV